ncbi:Switch [Lachnellula hyalina]|uniref:Switch n=1 Tax=Lachnellula hyalina TaxID=1316788 RepID=A0A8H8U3X5_9HELO|nr:Switch [Lachnellula hyalina]TVY29622.1 Switch [Lachnellula hyalina]
MSHLAQAEGYEEEQTEDEDAFESRNGRGKAVVSTDDYIKRIVGTPAGTDSDSDVEITDIRPSNLSKGKRKVGEKVQWSDDESDNAYEKFKNRKATKRKKIAATNKKIKAKAKDAATGTKKAKANGEPVKKKERMWGDESDDGMMDDNVPLYIINRRKDFDHKHEQLAAAGLQLPPNYEDVYFSDDERLVDLQERPDFPETVEQSQLYKDIELPHSLGIIPASIAQYLRGYQVEGVAFLHELFVYQKGGILGDDMGLGKTVQVAAFLTAAFGKSGDERDAKRMRKMRRAPSKPWYPRVLIVCPGSLIQNWKNELERWGWWHVDKFHGDVREKTAVLESAKSGRLEIIITTYTTYKNHKDEINTIKWDCVVADECHQLKERSSQITQAMDEVNALCRIGLTGTAIQNKYEELWTLLNWTNPGRFGPLSTWKSSISEPLRTGQSHDATYHQLKNARETAKRLVNNLLPQFFLRRMKSLIAHQLPKKTDKVVFCPLTELQESAYEQFLGSDAVQCVKNSTEPCECGSGKKAGWCCNVYVPDSNTKWQSLVFPVITTLQKLSNHLALLIPNSGDQSDKQQRDLDFLQQMVPDRWRELYANRDSLSNLSNPDFCGKWRILKKLLKFWHENGDKVLIFSHSVKLLKMLQHLFNNTSYNVSFLSGSMPNEDRQTTVDDFNTDPRQFVFLISTKAGGVGLNITSANKVVIFDPNWNPSYDLQAQDRAYRIGQLRDVEVFRLVSAGTVEEIVYARQIYKQQQANIGYNASTERRYFKGVQHAKQQKGEIFGLDNLLTFHADNIVLRDIVNKTNVAEAKRGVDILEMNMDDAANDEDNPLKVDDDDNGNGAMSQLVALIEKGEDLKKKKVKSKPKTNTIQGILAAAGVQYTHENSEVVGSSKVEAELSRRAQETGNDVDYGEERLFAESQSFSSDPGRIQYQYHPPNDVMMRQFCTMAKTFGFASATEFALIVEGWTQKQRTDCLERFYLKRKERMADLEAGNQPEMVYPSEARTQNRAGLDDETDDDMVNDMVDNVPADDIGAENQADEDLLADILEEPHIGRGTDKLSRSERTGAGGLIRDDEETDDDDVDEL